MAIEMIELITLIGGTLILSVYASPLIGLVFLIVMMKILKERSKRR